MAEVASPLYVGTNGHVAALDPWTGEEVWRTKLPKCGGLGEPVTIVIKNHLLLAGAYGQVWCLDKRTGAVLWHNGLPKLGYHAVLMTMEGADASTGPEAAAVEAVRRRRQRAAAAGAGGAAAAT